MPFECVRYSARHIKYYINEGWKCGQISISSRYTNTNSTHIIQLVAVMGIS